MGKRGKKGRTPVKEKRVPVHIQKKIPQESKSAEGSVESTVLVPNERKPCEHVDIGFKLNELSAKLGSLDHIRCEDCREGAVDRRGNKGKGKHGKKKVDGSVDLKSEVKAIWVCLQCGHCACGGVGFPTTQSHATRHAGQTRHPLAIQLENPSLRWCFRCRTPVPMEKTEDGEYKDIFSEVVKLIKGRSVSGSAGDVEDVWFGSGSVTSEVKLENSVSCSLDVKGGYVVRGLVNLGNTCFFNSVIQNLLALERLQKYFFKLDASFGPLTISLKKLFAEAKMETGGKSAINPRSLFGSICSKAPQFRGYQQHDSHEFLRCLLDVLSTEEFDMKKRVKSSTDEGDPPNQSLTFIDAVFGGQISSTVCCVVCGHSSTVYEPFLDLSLPVPTKKPPPKKSQPVSRAKKAKVLPKKGAKSRQKVNRDIDSIPNNIQSTPVRDEPLESNPVGKDERVASGVSRPVTSNQSTALLMETNSVLQDHAASKEEGNVDLIGEAAKQTAVSLDDLSWLDYLGSDKPLESNPVGKDERVASSGVSKPVTSNQSTALLMETNSVLQDHAASKEEGNVDLIGEAAKQTAVSLDDLSWLDYLGSDDLSSEKWSVSQNDNYKSIQDSSIDNVVSDQGDNPFLDKAAAKESSSILGVSTVKEFKSEQFSGEAVEEKAASCDNFTWLDYLDSERVSDETPILSQMQDLIHIQDQGTGTSAMDSPLQNDLGSLHQIGCQDEPKQVLSSQNSWEQDEPLLHVHDSEVLLLPYKEETSTAAETMGGECVASSMVYGNGQEESEFDGFGDMFNEPEVTSGPVRSTSVDDDQRTNEVMDSGFMAGNSSESDGGEIDDSNSPVSVETCLSHFTKPEVLRNDNAWHCENCSKRLQKQWLESKKKKKKKQELTGDPNHNIKEKRSGTNSTVVNGDSSHLLEVNHTNGAINTDPFDTCQKEGQFEIGNLEESSPENADNHEAVNHNLATSEGQKDEIKDTLPETSNVSSCCIEPDHSNHNDQAISSCVDGNINVSGSKSNKEMVEVEETDSRSMTVKRDATKRVLISKAPPILTIHLKRFSQDTRGRLSKLSGHIVFGETIDLRPYLDLRSKDAESCVYRLIGVVEHMGTMRGGHYVAYVRGDGKKNGNGSSVWYHASDTYVREVSLEEVLRREAYILFYEVI